MPSLMAMILAAVGPILAHRVLPPHLPFFFKALLDIFIFISVFYLVNRILTNLRPDIDA